MSVIHHRQERDEALALIAYYAQQLEQAASNNTDSHTEWVQAIVQRMMELTRIARK